MPDKNITFEIREYLGTLAKHDSGWTKELNIISWNGQQPKYDIRDWDEHHERMSRGVTLYPSEMRKVVELYLSDNNRRNIEEGKAREAERYERRQEMRKTYAETKAAEQDLPDQEAVEQEALEGATPFEEEQQEEAVSF